MSSNGMELELECKSDGLHAHNMAQNANLFKGLSFFLKNPLDAGRPLCQAILTINSDNP